VIFPKSVAHFLKVGGSFSQSRWLIFLKPVANFTQNLFVCREQETRLGNLKAVSNLETQLEQRQKKGHTPDSTSSVFCSASGGLQFLSISACATATSN